MSWHMARKSRRYFGLTGYNFQVTFYFLVTFISRLPNDDRVPAP